MNACITTKSNLVHQDHTPALPTIIALHLIPGILITLFYLAIVPAMMALGYPPMAAMLLAILFVAIPLELGELIRRGWVRNGKLSLKGIVTMGNPLPIRQYILLPLAFLLLAFLVTGAASIADNALGSLLGRWLPEWFFLNNPATYAQYSRSALLITLAGNICLNMLAAPVVEELYFRGFLLPRLSHMGKWAPVLNALLFTLYHFWQPYAYPSILLVITPMVYLAWRKQNVLLAILIHCAMNTIGNLVLFSAILKP
jgi:uncharacterized protein